MPLVPPSLVLVSMLRFPALPFPILQVSPTLRPRLPLDQPLLSLPFPLRRRPDPNLYPHALLRHLALLLRV